jgi:hypothetical protein
VCACAKEKGRGGGRERELVAATRHRGGKCMVYTERHAGRQGGREGEREDGWKGGSE